MKIFASLITIIIINTQCQDNLKNEITFLKPDYSKIQINPTKDTISFTIPSTGFNSIRSFNYFINNKKEEFIAFYDKQSSTVNFYSFNTQFLIKSIQLKKCLPGRKVQNKTTVYVKNIDSIYILNYLTLYRLNNLGLIMDSLPLETSSYVALSSFSNQAPPIFNNNTLYIKASPYLSPQKSSDIKKWMVLYRLNITNKEIELQYHLPKIYFQNNYSFKFLDNSYCYNNHGEFVFSFSADTNIYRTDLKNYQNIYFGKSKYQIGDIKVKNKNASSEEDMKDFLFSNSYGAIFFDRFRKRYLRIAEQKINEWEYTKKNWRKKQSLIIFDENLKIIGESLIDKNIDLSSILFTKDGNIYARINAEDEKAINFIRLEFNDEN